MQQVKLNELKKIRFLFLNFIEAWSGLMKIENTIYVIAETCPYGSNKEGEISYDADFDSDTFPDCEFENWLFDNPVNAESDHPNVD